MRKLWEWIKGLFGRSSEDRKDRGKRMPPSPLQELNVS